MSFVNGILLVFFSSSTPSLSLSSSLLFVLLLSMAAGTMITIELQMNAPQEQTIQLCLISAHKSFEELLLYIGCVYVCVHVHCNTLHFTTFYRQTWQLNNLIGFHSLSNDALFEHMYVCMYLSMCMHVLWGFSHLSQPYHITYVHCTVWRFQILIDTIHWAGLKCFQLHPNVYTLWTLYLARLYPAHLINQRGEKMCVVATVAAAAVVVWKQAQWNSLRK